MIVLEIFQKDTGYIIQKKFCTCTQILSLLEKKNSMYYFCYYDKNYK